MPRRRRYCPVGLPVHVVQRGNNRQTLFTSDLYLSLGQNKAERQRAWREGVKEVLETDTIARIRHCANTGLVLGTEKFRAQVATLTT